MNHILLTGGTGLLGGYLIRDLLLKGFPLAVLVRPGRRVSAESRVEQILQHWEPVYGRLKMPKILVGDISQPSLGLTEEDQLWAARHCESVIHSAASLKFQPVGDEPWNTNLGGTRNVIELCERCRIPQLHYVSTAYVCGRINGVAYERSAESDAEPRNVYESSKRQAEQLVMNSDLMEPPSILRPSIIIGDSETGYTTTFHGPYLPLRLALSVLSPGTGMSAGTQVFLDPYRILKMMGLSGQETKNVVPVDWVSQCITRVATSPDLHGQIYHLTAAEPLDINTLTRTTVEFVSEYCNVQPSEQLKDDLELDRFFTSQLTVYKDYWADDPKFDAMNRSLAMPDIPPPVIDELLLRRTFQFAADTDQQKKLPVQMP